MYVMDVIYIGLGIKLISVVNSVLRVVFLSFNREIFFFVYEVFLLISIGNMIIVFYILLDIL